MEKKTTIIEALVHEDNQLDGEFGLNDVLMSMPEPKTKQIHVLVVVPTEKADALTAIRGTASSMTIPVAEPTEISVIIKEVRSSVENWRELTYYQQRGRLIQDSCRDYCANIFNKIGELYNEEIAPLPFICVEGSSGMGKSQGRGPTTNLYANFSSISDAFRKMVKKDSPKKKSEKVILDSRSNLYQTDLLWTYGFIIELLEYCSSDEH
ncbi:hypothetical protein Plhal304r1_c010g0039641 [Plasmopara halstedii]